MEKGFSAHTEAKTEHKDWGDWDSDNNDASDSNFVPSQTQNSNDNIPKSTEKSNTNNWESDAWDEF